MESYSYGLELELPALEQRGKVWKAENYLQELEQTWQKQGYQVHHTLDNGHLIDIYRYDSPNNCSSKTVSNKNADNKILDSRVVAGFDCVYNTLELAIGPYQDLASLHKQSTTSYNQILEIAQSNQAQILNFSELPNFEANLKNYQDLNLHKTFYKYLTEIRGHSHYVGTDSKAQISPSIGIAIKDAIQAENLILKLSPVFIALYANSPYEAGQDKQMAENRLTIWAREFATSVFCSDLLSTLPPKNFFQSWQHYFQYLYDSAVPIYAVAKEKGSLYKNNKELCHIIESPNLIAFLQKDSWQAKEVSTGKDILVQPHFEDIVSQQFSLFLDARVRFAFKSQDLQIKDFLHAYQQNSQYFEDYLLEHLAYTYIENRPAGSNCPDEDLKAQAQDPRVTSTVHIAISALQAGIIRSHEEVEAYLAKNNYQAKYQTYRQSAIIHALNAKCQDEKLIDLIQDLLRIIKNSLTHEEQAFLAYIEYNLDNRTSAADRAKALIAKHTVQAQVNWQAVHQQRTAIKI